MSAPQTQQTRPLVGEKTTTFGGGVDKVTKYNWTVVDDPGVLYYVKKNQLKVDPSYQRVMSENRVAQIAQAWSWVACGTLIVAERADRSLWLIDGQQRHAAAMRRSDIDELPTNVFVSHGVESEAQAFFRANCLRGNVSAFDKMRAMITAGDRLYIDAAELMASAGYRPSRDEAAFGVRCVARFIALMKSDRGLLEKAWPLVAQLHEEMCIKQRVLVGLLYVARYGTDDITISPWRERVLRAGISTLSMKIDQRVQQAAVTGSARRQAEGVLEVINRGVRERLKMRLQEPSEGQEEATPAQPKE